MHVKTVRIACTKWTGGEVKWSKWKENVKWSKKDLKTTETKSKQIKQKNIARQEVCW